MQGNLYYDKKFIERKGLKRAANCIGLAFILGEAISWVLQYILLFVLMLFGKTEILADEGISWMLQIAFSALVFTVPFAVMARPMGTSASACCKFSKPKKEALVPLLLVGLGVCMIANVLGSMFSSVFSAIGIESTPTDFESDILKGWFFPVISILGGAILPALVEEFALRGVVLGSLRKYGDTFAIIVSAALFGIMHGNLEQMPFAFIIGLYLGFITVKTGSVWSAVLLHLINNGFAFMFSIFASVLGQAEIIINATYFFVMIILGLVGIAKAKDLELFSLPQDNDVELTLSKRITTVFFAPAIIIYMCCVVLKIVLLNWAV